MRRKGKKPPKHSVGYNLLILGLRVIGQALDGHQGLADALDHTPPRKPPATKPPDTFEELTLNPETGNYEPKKKRP